VPCISRLFAPFARRSVYALDLYAHFTNLSRNSVAGISGAIAHASAKYPAIIAVAVEVVVYISAVHIPLQAGPSGISPVCHVPGFGTSRSPEVPVGALKYQKPLSGLATNVGSAIHPIG